MCKIGDTKRQSRFGGVVRFSASDMHAALSRDVQLRRPFDLSRRGMYSPACDRFTVVFWGYPHILICGSVHFRGVSASGVKQLELCEQWQGLCMQNSVIQCVNRREIPNFWRG